jgi:hypothetical protein
MKYKKGDIVVVLEDIKTPSATFLKAGEVCEVLSYYDEYMLDLQSLSPSYENGNWVCKIDNVVLAPEIFQVLP